jgi:hypothetical protein
MSEISLTQLCGSFFKNNEIPKIHIKLNRDNSGKKTPCYTNKYISKGTIDKFTDEEIKEHNRKIDLDDVLLDTWAVKLKDSGFVVIDTDSEDADNIIHNKLLQLKTKTATITTNGGRHYYFKIKNYEHIKKVIKINNTDIDLITDFIWEGDRRKVQYYDTIYEFENINALYNFLDYEPKETEVEKKLTIESNHEQVVDCSEILQTEKEDLDKLKDALNNINPEVFNSYKSWFNLMAAMYNQDKSIETLDFLQDYLKNIPNYNEDENSLLWMKFRKMNLVQGAGVIYKCLKDNNPDYFKKIIKKKRTNIYPNYFHSLGTYEEKKEYFEKFVCKINGSGKITFLEKDNINNDYKEYGVAELKNRFKNYNVSPSFKPGTKLIDVEKKDLKCGEFTKFWLSDINLRDYENIDFLPRPLECDNYTFNLYDGLRVEKEMKDVEGKGDISRILKHLYYLGGENKTNQEFIIKQMAYKVKYPAKLTRVSIIFRSLQGAGKNLLSDFFGKKILGTKYYVCSANPDAFLGKFNNRIKGKLFCIFNEVEGKDCFGASSKLKELTTEDTIQYEAKHANSHDIKNCALIWYFTNNRNPITIETSDRRFVVFDCSKSIVGNEEYFNALVKDMNDPLVQKAFYDYLMNYDIDIDYNFQKNRPITDAYKQMKSASIPLMVRFFNHLFEVNEDPEELQEYLTNISASKLYSDFNLFKTTQNEKSEMSRHKFTNCLTDYKEYYTKDTKEKNKVGIKYTFDYDKLYELVEENYSDLDTL